MSNAKPICDYQGQSTDSVLSSIWKGAGVLGTIGGILGWVFRSGVWTILGITAPALYWLAAAIAALATLFAVISFAWDRCGQDPKGLRQCSAGVINEIVPSFNSVSDE